MSLFSSSSVTKSVISTNPAMSWPRSMLFIWEGRMLKRGKTAKTKIKKIEWQWFWAELENSHAGSIEGWLYLLRVVRFALLCEIYKALLVTRDSGFFQQGCLARSFGKPNDFALKYRVKRRISEWVAAEYGYSNALTSNTHQREHAVRIQFQRHLKSLNDLGFGMKLRHAPIDRQNHDSCHLVIVAREALALDCTGQRFTYL